MIAPCIRCGTTENIVPDEHGFDWCGRCYFLTRIEAAGGIDQLERYLQVKARRGIVVYVRGERTLAERIREYTDGDAR